MTSRISQSMLYTSFMNYLNQTTSSLQKLYEQGSTQKKINNPSDNPVGMARILSYRDSIKALSQYQTNINNSKGWLGLADTTLKQVEDQLTRLKELAVRASNGTLNERDRKSILNEVKQIFDQLLSLANTTYEGRSIFAGHKTDMPAYEKGLAVYSNQDDTNPAYQYIENIEGYTDETLVIEFSEKLDSSGTSLTDPDGDGFAQIGIDDNIQYRVLKGDGKLIHSGELNAGETTLDLGKVKIDLKKGYNVVVNETRANKERTQLIIAPTAIYKGDNESGSGVEIINGTPSSLNLKITPQKNGSFENEVLVKIVSGDTIGSGNPVTYQYSFDGGVTWSDELEADNPNSSSNLELELPGGKITISVMDNSLPTPNHNLGGLSFKIGSIDVEQSTTDLYAFAQGDIHENIVVRIDKVTQPDGITPGTGFTNGDIIEYSYSTDGGITWNSGHQITSTGAGYQTLPVEGGLLRIASSTLTPSLSPGDQFVIHPRDASMESEIYQGVDVSVTHVGTQIFGGFYKNTSGMEMAFATDEKNNLFVGIGKLIAALELNHQENISGSLDYIDAALNQVAKIHVKIGAKLNRLNITESILTDLQLNQTERKSFIEDVDFAELLTKISQQQTVYQAILKSASMIMKVSLVNYV